MGHCHCSLGELWDLIVKEMVVGPSDEQPSGPERGTDQESKE